MPDFKKLFQEVLHQRPDIDESTLSGLIQEKKKRVGAGYLTDQGALFLVAADLGVSLEAVAAATITLKDLYIGANEITVVGRVFALYPAQKYQKRDGTEGEYRRIILFDSDTFVRVTLWDDKARVVDQLGIGPNSIVTVLKGYAKAGLDGSPVLNVGARGNLEILQGEEAESKLPTIEKISKDVSSISSPETYLAVHGYVRSPPKLSEFTRKDGTPGKVINLYLTGLQNGRETRVAIWGTGSTTILNLPVNAFVRMVNAKARIMPHGEIELHGDESTILELLPSQPEVAHGEQPQYDLLRLVSLGTSLPEKDGTQSVAGILVDENKNLFTIIARDEAHGILSQYSNDSFVECVVGGPTKSVIVCRSSDDLRLAGETELHYPGFKELVTKINVVKEGSTPLFLEVIALSRSNVQEVVARDGSTVKRGEVVVGDETGETRIVAWRNLTRLLEGISPGQRLWLRGLVAQPDRNGISLQVRSFSSIDRLS